MAANPPANPYANGLINLPAMGGNGATTETAVWDPTLNSYAIQYGGQYFPIYNDSQAASLKANPAFTQYSHAGSGGGWGTVDNGDGTYGTDLTLKNSNGTSQFASYYQDPTTGYYVPVGFQTTGAPSTSFWSGVVPPLETIGGAAAIGAALPAAAGAAGVDAATAGADAAGASASAGADAAGTTLSSAGAAGLGPTTGLGPTAGAASFDPGYGAMINGTANSATDASTMGYGAVGSPGSAAFPGSGIPSGITGTSALSNALSNPQLVGKGINALGNLFGLGNNSGTNAGSGGGVNLGALQGAIGGGVTPAKMATTNNQKLAQLLLATPMGEGVA